MTMQKSTTAPPEDSPDGSSRVAPTSNMLSVDDMEKMELARLDRIFGKKPDPAPAKPRG